MANTTLPHRDCHSLLPDPRPLRTASADTRIAHPKPVNQPVSSRNLPPGSPLGSIAQLEATAERLSMTSSIDDAIRHLHTELKRSDSRPSSKLAASVRAPSTDVCNNCSNSAEAAAATGQPKRHLSTSSSIVSTNMNARHGGYSPAAFVMSPTHSLSGRLRPGSKNSAGKPEVEFDTVLSRHGPGKDSGRSARSTNMSLADISESGPVSPTQGPCQNTPSTNAFYQMLRDCALGRRPPQTGTAELLGSEHPRGRGERNAEARPVSSHSNNTFKQCQEAFVDFDGVHWEPEHEEHPFASLDMEPDVPALRADPSGMVRPQSYLDRETGQQMLYYPARVPAMLNLPPKLSRKPKAALRNQRRSQILSAMMGSDSNNHSAAPECEEHSWLPDPVAGHRDSFAALSSYGPFQDPKAKTDQDEDEAEASPEAGPEVALDARLRPRRPSATGPEKRKSRASLFLSRLPPQLRASAFFDVTAIPADIQVQDESAMATLDSILDASANAPVSAFTDPVLAAKLGSEVHRKKRKNNAGHSPAARTALSPEEPGSRKKRSSLMWLGKRSGGDNGEDKTRPRSMASAPALGANYESRHAKGRTMARRSGDEDEPGVGAVESGTEDDDESDAEDAYCGPPTTLVAELHLRKQEQQQRKKNLSHGFPDGMHATLLEMDTVAETQRKNRQTKRVNLAWEEPEAHVDQNGSDDEDVPLAILAAMHQGAKNKADLARPMGLVQQRELEDNEPLSHRRARLQGLEPPPPRILQNHQSVMALPALGAAGDRSQHSGTGPSGEPEEEVESEVQSETREGQLPRARPVSSDFSAELLSQFGEMEQAKEKPADGGGDATQEVDGAEETLGQRRRRLQAEREAREQEMSHGNAAGEAAQRVSRRLSLADVLAAHPKRDPDMREQEEKRRVEEEKRATREREAKMAAMRKQMPRSLPVANIERSGGFRGGVYNDGTGGCGPLGVQPTPAANAQGFAHGPYGGYNRSSVLLNIFGTQQPVYGAASNLGRMKAKGFYNNSTMSICGGGMMAPGMQVAMPTSTGSMDRVEEWRRGVHP